MKTGTYPSPSWQPSNTRGCGEKSWQLWFQTPECSSLGDTPFLGLIIFLLKSLSHTVFQAFRLSETALDKHFYQIVLYGLMGELAPLGRSLWALEGRGPCQFCICPTTISLDEYKFTHLPLSTVPNTCPNLHLS